MYEAFHMEVSKVVHRTHRRRCRTAIREDIRRSVGGVAHDHLIYDPVRQTFLIPRAALNGAAAR